MPLCPPPACPRLPLNPGAVTEETGRGGCVWLVGRYTVVLTHSSGNHVDVTTPEHFLCPQLPQVARPRPYQIGKRLLGQWGGRKLS